MRTVFFVILFLITCPAFAQESPLFGEWQLTEMIYRGQRMPPLNPNLNLRWSFFSNGTSRLFWDRKGEAGFCERFAHFVVEGNSLNEQVFAVNPLNNFECSRDPDMQIGRRTSTRIEIEGNELKIYLQLADECLIYILKEVI